ncbi:MAG: hypothetical protein FJ102_06430 [Deltaproteobacteria bacterium]|nr:hypothetical protein [Deltaproteobacteria bacterium]
MRPWSDIVSELRNSEEFWQAAGGLLVALGVLALGCRGLLDTCAEWTGRAAAGGRPGLGPVVSLGLVCAGGAGAALTAGKVARTFSDAPGWDQPSASLVALGLVGVGLALLVASGVERLGTDRAEGTVTQFWSTSTERNSRRGFEQSLTVEFVAEGEPRSYERTWFTRSPTRLERGERVEVAWTRGRPEAAWVWSRKVVPVRAYEAGFVVAAACFALGAALTWARP